MNKKVLLWLAIPFVTVFIAILVIRLSKPTLDNTDPQIRIAAVKGYVTDQSQLINVATSDPEVEVRLAAIRKIVDQPTLLRIATTPPGGLEAFRTRTEKELIRGYLKSKGIEIPAGGGVVNPFTRSMLILPDVERQIAEIGRAAVERLDSKNLLTVIKANGLSEDKYQDFDRHYREITVDTAMKRIGDQTTIQAMAVDLSVPKSYQLLAIELTTDLGLLRQIASERDGFRRRHALVMLALREPTAEGRKTALEQLPSDEQEQYRESLFLLMAQTDLEPTVRIAALKKIDQRKEGGTRSSFDSTRTEIAVHARLNEMTDPQTILKTIFERDDKYNGWLQGEAIRRVDDIQLLNALANDKRLSEYQQAEALLWIVDRAKPRELRLDALTRLKEMRKGGGFHLERIGLFDHDSKIRDAAIEVICGEEVVFDISFLYRISDPAILNRLSQQARDNKVKDTAAALSGDREGKPKVEGQR